MSILPRSSSNRRWLWAGLGTLASMGVSIAFVDRPLAFRAKMIAPAIRGMFEYLTMLGNSAWYLVPLGIAILVLAMAARRETEAMRATWLRWWLWAALFLFLAVALSGLLVDLLKIIFGRARPPLLFSAEDFGWHPLSLKPKFHAFPSGHANTVTALGLALGLIWPRLLKISLIVAAGLALTRIVVLAHYPSDVIAGAAVAVMTTLWLRRRFADRGWLFERGPDGRIEVH